MTYLRLQKRCPLGEGRTGLLLRMLLAPPGPQRARKLMVCSLGTQCPSPGRESHAAGCRLFLEGDSGELHTSFLPSFLPYVPPARPPASTESVQVFTDCLCQDAEGKNSSWWLCAATAVVCENAVVSGAVLGGIGFKGCFTSCILWARTEDVLWLLFMHYSGRVVAIRNSSRRRASLG